MRVLFVMHHSGYVRNYEGVLRQLAAEGHQVHIADELGRNKMGENSLGLRLAEECPGITMGRAALPEETYWTKAARTGRLLRDYLRYLDPGYDKASSLRQRAAHVVPDAFQPLAGQFHRLDQRRLAWVRAALAFFERAAPLSASILEFLKEQHPDVLLVTPLVEPGSIQVDYIKCASALRIPTALCVASWDNLTNKGLMRVVPDRVFVWNDAQREEAIALHDVPADRVVVTGAQIFDHWFTWKPSCTRELFCAARGLDPARPFVLYLGSSYFIAPNEAEFGDRWIAALRLSDDPVIAGAGILIRPHPSNGLQWQGLDLASWHHTSIWPPPGADMFAPEFKNDFFDALYYCAAVVGVNTSAQIEAAIVGKAVCTVQAPDFEHSQGGTLHFQHLVRGGLVRMAATLDEHVTQLGAIVRDPEAQAARSRRFVESFVRPFGLDVAATPRLAAAIGEAATARPPVSPASQSGVLVRLLLSPIAALVAWLPDRRPWWAYVLKVVLGLGVQLWALPYRLASGAAILHAAASRYMEAAAATGRQAGRKLSKARDKQRKWRRRRMDAVRRAGRQLGRSARGVRSAARRVVRWARVRAGSAWRKAGPWRSAE
jgi:hypothetical protein